MREVVGDATYRDRRLVLAAIGVLLLIIGAVAAFLGPLEMYCFYLFSEGGRFHYDGFGFGSFMFGNIAFQIIGYYLIALLCIPLGYGHVRVRRWARTLSLVLLRFWLVVGIPLTVVFLFILLTAKDLSLAAALVAVVFLGVCYFVLPALLIRFYRSRGVRLTFEARDPGSCWMEKLPTPILVLCTLFLFYVVALHVPIFFRGLFPLFGVWLSDLEGIFMIDVSILCLVCLIWGTLTLRPWAWWGSLIYFGLLTVSTVLTLWRSSFLEILSKLDLPPTEMEAFQGLPVQGVHFAVFVGVPLLVTWGLVVVSRSHFETG